MTEVEKLRIWMKVHLLQEKISEYSVWISFWFDKNTENHKNRDDLLLEL